MSTSTNQETTPLTPEQRATRSLKLATENLNDAENLNNTYKAALTPEATARRDEEARISWRKWNIDFLKITGTLSLPLIIYGLYIVTDEIQKGLPMMKELSNAFGWK